MQKKFIRIMVPLGLAGAILLGLVLFSIQTLFSQSVEVKSSKLKLEEVKSNLDSNGDDIEKLTKSLSQEYISKAKTFAYILNCNQELLTDNEGMSSLANIMGVDELHVSDDKGKLIAGNVPEYIGFDLSTSDQAAEFMKILDNPTLEIAQEPQPNGAEGKMFQYIGVSRLDAKGIIQIGMTPDKLNETLAENTIDSVLGKYKNGNTGFVFAINTQDKTIAY